MTFEEILNQAIALLQRQGRVSYRALKRQFDLDEAYVEDLKLELIEVHQVAADQDNTMLVWVGGAAALPPAAANAACGAAMGWPGVSRSGWCGPAAVSLTLTRSASSGVFSRRLTVGALAAQPLKLVLFEKAGADDGGPPSAGPSGHPPLPA